MLTFKLILFTLWKNLKQTFTNELIFWLRKCLLQSVVIHTCNRLFFNYFIIFSVAMLINFENIYCAYHTMDAFRDINAILFNMLCKTLLIWIDSGLCFATATLFCIFHKSTFHYFYSVNQMFFEYFNFDMNL